MLLVFDRSDQYERYAMSHTHTPIELTVLDMIENSPVGAVPHTPTYQDALRKLHATHQVYSSADFKDGHVTVRSLTQLPLFYANNLDALIAGAIDIGELETNASIFDRYVQSLPEALREKAESRRLKVVGRAIHHRKHHGPGEAPVVHDPVHSIFLVPGAGLHPGIAGNYLYGALNEVLHGETPATWNVQLQDSEDAVSTVEAASLAEALTALQDVIASAPFELSELAALGFKAN
jgi:hypothetical protein